jgi:hypothetical protein
MRKKKEKREKLLPAYFFHKILQSGGFLRLLKLVLINKKEYLECL